MLDTPGFNIFINDTRAALVAADAALDRWWTAWPASKCRPKKSGTSPTDFQLPRAILINKLDRERSSFDRALESVSSANSAAPPFLSSFPSAPSATSRASIDLVQMKAYTYTPDGDGKGKEGEIPGRPRRRRAEGPRSADRDGGRGQRRAAWRNSSTRARCPPSTSSRACAPRCARCASIPVLCASALHNIGTDLILNFLSEHFRRAPERSPAHAACRTATARSTARSPTPSPVSAFVFKTVADPFAGRVTYFKVISGVVKNDANLYNPQRNVERSGWRISARLMGKTITARERAARRRHRRGGEAEGHADQRYAVRQEIRRSSIPPSSCPSLRSRSPSRPSRGRMRIAWATRCTRFSRKINRCASIAIRRPRTFCSRARASSTWRSSSAG